MISLGEAILKNVAIIPAGTLPLPPVCGGAVENLVDLLRKYNTPDNEVKLTFFSIYDAKAKQVAQENENTRYIFVRIPVVIRWFDWLLFWVVTNIFRKGKNMSYRYIFQRVYYIGWVSYYLKRHQFDRVVLENHATLLWIIRLFNNTKKYAGKYYYHMHNTIPNFYHCQEIFEKAAAIIGVSLYILTTLPSDVQSHVKTVVLKNRVDESQFKLQLSHETEHNLRQQFRLGNKKVVLFTGRFSPVKGIKQLLQAWAILKPTNAVLLIVGGAYFKSDIKTKFEEEMAKLATQMADSVRVTGFIDYQKIPLLYALADLVVLPSMWDDPAPLTIIEALTAEKRLITTYSGGIPEYTNSTTIVLKRDKDLIANLCSSIKESLSSSVPLQHNDWHFIDYYEQFLEILGLK